MSCQIKYKTLDEQAQLRRLSPVAATSHEELMQRKLAVKILSDFLDTLRVSCLAKVGVETTRIAVQQVFATAQV